MSYGTDGPVRRAALSRSHPACKTALLLRGARLMKPPSQTNAIDFDSAKLQRLGFGQQPPLLERPVSLAQMRQQLGLQLQTSLEPQRILGTFYREIQRLVPLDALCYLHKSSDLRLEF